ncbi:MAG: glycerol-3-phosphate 1-O-acyltransferase PlsY [Ruminococcaceae bacterium]|nr:glycerol-3-phosphate 1-O-acyltransferase PlsY [Oscillospiraceae bacterium]
MLYFFLNNPVGYMGLLGSYYNAAGTPIPQWLSIVSLLVYTLVPYMLGSINTAVIVSHVMYKDDIRKYGSGNAGFTNVMRTFGFKAAAITFTGDILKAIVSVMLGWCFLGYLSAYIAGFACFIGHILPCFYQFKGGKGVLCSIAMIFVLDIRIFFVLVALFLIAVAITKYISFGSILGAMVFPILLNRINPTNPRLYMIEIIAVAIGVIVVFKHRENLKRIFNGTESKFSFKKSKKQTDESDNEAENG